jgi:hypothetical protein
MHFLGEEERAQLKLQHKIERDKRVSDRIKAVLLYDKGWTTKQIAEALLNICSLERDQQPLEITYKLTAQRITEEKENFRELIKQHNSL